MQRASRPTSLALLLLGLLGTAAGGRLQPGEPDGSGVEPADTQVSLNSPSQRGASLSCAGERWREQADAVLLPPGASW